MKSRPAPSDKTLQPPDVDRRNRSRLRLRHAARLAAIVGLAMAAISAVSLPAEGAPTTEHAQDPAGTQPVARIVDYPTSSDTSPAGLTSGPEGRLWFTRDISAAKIGSFDPRTGHFDYYSLNQGIDAFKAQGIAVGPDGHLWMAANGTYAYQFDPATSVSEHYREPVGGAEQSVTFGPDGDMWFAGSDVLTTGCRIFSVDPATGVFTPHVVKAGSCYLFGITTGPGGTLWFTDPDDNAVGEFDPSTGKANEFPIPTVDAWPDAITEGADHALWFTEQDSDSIGRIDPTTHVISQFKVPTAGATPRAITAGPDGNLWFTEENHAAIGSVDPSTGAVREYSVAAVDPNGADTFLDGIVVGPDGDLWFTDEAGELLRFRLSPTVVSQPTSQRASLGSTVRFTSTGKGIPAPSVQWETSSDGGASWSVLAGATSTTLSLTASPNTAAAEYRAVFTSSAGSVASAPASLTLENSGYWMAGRDGGVFAFGGAPFLGSLPEVGVRPAAPIVEMVPTLDGKGYWLLGADGGVFAFGDAGFFGSLPSRGVASNGTVVGMAPTADGEGYWVLDGNGDVFSFGDAQDLGGAAEGSDSVGVAASGDGYWITDSAGAITPRGTAVNFGSLTTSTPPVRPSAPIVGIAGHLGGNGYWLAGADGGVFAFGGAPFLGSLQSSAPTALSAPIVALAAVPDGEGYWLAGADGGAFAFGDASFAGSLPALGVTLTPAEAIVSLAAQP